MHESWAYYSRKAATVFSPVLVTQFIWLPGLLKKLWIFVCKFSDRCALGQSFRCLDLNFFTPVAPPHFRPIKIHQMAPSVGCRVLFFIPCSVQYSTLRREVAVYTVSCWKREPHEHFSVNWSACLCKHRVYNYCYGLLGLMKSVCDMILVPPFWRHRLGAGTFRHRSLRRRCIGL